MIRRDLVFEIGRTLIAIALALLLGFVIVLLVSEEPLNAFINFVAGPLTTTRRIGNWIEATIPLILPVGGLHRFQAGSSTSEPRASSFSERSPRPSLPSPFNCPCTSMCW